MTSYCVTQATIVTPKSYFYIRQRIFLFPEPPLTTYATGVFDNINQHFLLARPASTIVSNLSLCR